MFLVKLLVQIITRRSCVYIIQYDDHTKQILSYHVIYSGGSLGLEEVSCLYNDFSSL